MGRGRPEGSGGSQSFFEREVKNNVQFADGFKNDETANKRRLIDMIRTPSMREPLLALPPDLHEMSEVEINKMVGSLPRVCHALKLRFWELYRKCQRDGGYLNLSDLTENICNWEYLTDKVFGNPIRLAWLITPPADEIEAQKLIIHLGRQRLYEAMNLPLSVKEPRVVLDNKTGDKITVEVERVNVPLIKAINDIVKTMEDRVYGAVTQKHQIEQHTLQVNVNQPAQLPTSVGELDALEARIKALKAQVTSDQQALPAGEVVDGDTE